MTASRPLEHGASGATWPAVPRGAAVHVTDLVARAAGASAAAAAVGCGAVIALRRLSGVIEPAGPALLLGAAAVGIALVIATDAARRGGAPVLGSIAARCGLVVSIVALAVPPRAPGVVGWGAAAAALLATAVAVVRMPRHDRRRVAARDLPAGRTAPAERRRRPRHDPQPGFLRQRFERRELPAGAERVRGRVVVAVPAGAKAGYGHLGFCPAFAATPAVEVTTAYDGVEATVTAAEVLPWGVRVECRLAEPAEEPVEIPVDLVALATAPVAAP